MSSRPADEPIFPGLSKADAKWLASRLQDLLAVLGVRGEHWAKREVERGRYTLNDAIRKVVDLKKGVGSGPAERRSRLLAQFISSEIRNTSPLWQGIQAEISRHLNNDRETPSKGSDAITKDFDWFIVKRFNDLVGFQELVRVLTSATEKAKYQENITAPSPTDIPEDIKPWLSELTSKSVTTRIATVDAAAQLNRLDSALHKELFRLSANQIKEILSHLTRWLNKAIRSPTRHVFSLSTIDMLTRNFYVLLKALLDSSSREDSFAVYRTSEKTLFDVCTRGDQDHSWVFFLDFLSYTSDIVDLPANRRVSPESLGDLYPILKTALSLALITALERGRIEQATLINVSVMRHHELAKELRHDILDRYQSDPAKFPSTSQEWILRTFDIRASRQIQYASAGESPAVKKAAVLLLRLWDQKEKGIGVSLFEEYSELAGNYFKIFLRGLPGEIVSFDPRFHESDHPRSGQVRVIRPRVEWIDPPKGSVVIRSVIADPT